MIQQRIGPGDGMKRTRQWAANHFLSSSLSLIQINGLAAVNLSFSFRTPSITRRNPLSCVSMLLIFWMLSQQNFFSFLIHAFKVKNSSSTTLKRKRAPELLIGSHLWTHRSFSWSFFTLYPYLLKRRLMLRFSRSLILHYVEDIKTQNLFIHYLVLSYLYFHMLILLYNILFIS